MQQLAETIASEYRHHDRRHWLITSALHGEGCTTSTRLLAATLIRLFNIKVAVLHATQLDEQRLLNLLSELDEHGRLIEHAYDICLFDSSCVLGNALTMRLADSCDGALMVTKAESSNKDVVHEALLSLKRREVNIAGMVLTQRRRRIPMWLYRCL